MNYIWYITPMGAPRTTRADAWKKRPVILKYHKFRDDVASCMKKSATDWSKVDSLAVTFHMPMPPSWSNKKKIQMGGEPHRQKPDIDNLVKALLDSIFREGDDCRVYNIRATKLWSRYAKIEITI